MRKILRRVEKRERNVLDTLFLKLILTPLLIAGTTLATRRWGPTVGGWLVGLPLTSGPVSFFLLIEQGRDFAAASAHSTLNGLIAVVAFCLAYERGARKHAWPVAVLAALAAYFAVVAVFSNLRLPLGLSVCLVFAVITLGALLMKPVKEPLPALAAPLWDLPFRILAATSLVVGVTVFSRKLGPQLSGMFSTFPVFTCVMSVFSHQLMGPLAIRKFHRGVIVGSYAFAAFFITIVLTIRQWNPVFVYPAAIGATLAVNYTVYRALVFLQKEN